MCFPHEDLNLSCLVMRWSTAMLSLVFHYPELSALREKLHSRDSVRCYIAVRVGGGDEVSPKTIPSFNFFVLKEMFELRVWNCCIVCSDKRRAKALAASERFDLGHQHVKTNLSHRLQNTGEYGVPHRGLGKNAWPKDVRRLQLASTTGGVNSMRDNIVCKQHTSN